MSHARGEDRRPCPASCPSRGLGESERDPYSLWRRRGRRAPDDRVHLSVNIQLGHAPAGRVVGKADRDRLGALGERHRDFKQLQRRGKERHNYMTLHSAQGQGWGPAGRSPRWQLPARGPGTRPLTGTAPRRPAPSQCPPPGSSAGPALVSRHRHRISGLGLPADDHRARINRPTCSRKRMFQSLRLFQG